MMTKGDTNEKNKYNAVRKAYLSGLSKFTDDALLREKIVRGNCGCGGRSSENKEKEALQRQTH